MPPTEDTIEQPAKNATTDEWKAYAVTQGGSQADVEDLTRTELIDKYGSADEADDTAEAAKQEAYEAGEAMTAEDANPAVAAGAEDLPPHLRAAAVHRPISG